MHTKIRFTISLLLASCYAMACPVCEQQQPRLLKGITHGAGPQSAWDWVIISIITIITILVGYYSIKLLVRPAETAPHHIKHSILN